MKILKRIRQSLLFYKLRKFLDFLDSEKAIDVAIRYCATNELKGAYLEFGVHKGDSVKFAYMVMQLINYKLPMFGFDSFQGFPKHNNKFWKRMRVLNNPNDYYEEARKNLKSTQIKLIKGYYSETLKNNINYGFDKASIIFIDCDLYISGKEVFNYITPFLQDGTFIIIDDWNQEKARDDKGLRKAFYEWTKSKKIMYATLDIVGSKKTIVIRELKKRK